MHLSGCVTDRPRKHSQESWTLKITRIANGKVVFKLSDRMGAENVGELEAMVSHEKDGHGIVLDLKDLTLVDQEAVSFLERCQADRIQLKNCPGYVRE